MLSKVGRAMWIVPTALYVLLSISGALAASSFWEAYVFSAVRFEEGRAIVGERYPHEFGGSAKSILVGSSGSDQSYSPTPYLVAIAGDQNACKETDCIIVILEASEVSGPWKEIFRGVADGEPVVRTDLTHGDLTGQHYVWCIPSKNGAQMVAWQDGRLRVQSIHPDETCF